MNAQNTLVIGLGEIGEPLAEVLAKAHKVFRKDIQPLVLNEPIDVLHICYPYSIDNFLSVTSDYIQLYQPRIVMIHATMIPGTTRKVFEFCGVPAVYSPVKGKHGRMKKDLLSYTKFVSAMTPEASDLAKQHLEAANISVTLFSKPEALELAKLLETTYFGVLLTWAHEMERYCDELEVDYYEIAQFMEEVIYLPPVTFRPGYIGGHCVINNLELLDKVRYAPFSFTDLIRHSNDKKAEEWRRVGRNLEERLQPKQSG